MDDSFDRKECKDYSEMEKRNDKLYKEKKKYAFKMAFSKFVDNHTTQSSSEVKEWICCGATYNQLKDFHKHVALHHQEEIAAVAGQLCQQGSDEAKWKGLRKCWHDKTERNDSNLPVEFNEMDEYPWLPAVVENVEEDGKDKGRILLFYKYRDIENTEHVKQWQKCLCSRLKLSGKVRISEEGLNATVGGSTAGTQLYMDAVRAHPLFLHIEEDDFKSSPGGSMAFPDGLKVGIYKEAVPMGIDPKEVSHTDTGVHLSVDQFHLAVQKYNDTNSNMNKDAVFVDCRNFYESKVGKFEGALTPDIRKFSYWPEYVDQNPEIFADKEVYMYCTGGIRCERGSAYLKYKGLTSKVFQLSGGIHKYIEKYPDGFFRGKLFVFDDRYTIKANEDILSNCVYCESAWDQYQPCSSKHCFQLVLICDRCRTDLGRTACCSTCQKHMDSGNSKQECDCTRNRPRIPKESCS